MNFYKFDNENIRYTGRWGVNESAMAATATGSYFEFAFSGDCCIMYFNLTYSARPYNHIYISIDGGAKVEAELNAFIKLRAGKGEHTVTVINKSAMEMHHRFHLPLDGKVAFKGFEAENILPLKADNRKTIEFIGDSITEGVLVYDDRLNMYPTGQENRVFNDDVTETYAWKTAENLNLRPLFGAYGAVGLTHGGCGGYPDAITAYPYAFEGCKVNFAEPDYVLCNHGANDRGRENYFERYELFLNTVRELRPNSKIFVLGAFCGFKADELADFVEDYNKKHGDNVTYISSKGWVPVEPTHPLCDAHTHIANSLTEILKKLSV